MRAGAEQDDGPPPARRRGRALYPVIQFHVLSVLPTLLDLHYGVSFLYDGTDRKSSALSQSGGNASGARSARDGCLAARRIASTSAPSRSRPTAMISLTSRMP